MSLHLLLEKVSDLLTRKTLPTPPPVLNLEEVSPTRRADCSKGWERLQSCASFWEGRIRAREEYLREYQEEHAHEAGWIHISESARCISHYTNRLQEVQNV